MRINSLAVTPDGIQITYLEEADIDEATGIVMARTLEVPHEHIANSDFEDLLDSIRVIVDHALEKKRRPPESFVGRSR